MAKKKSPKANRKHQFKYATPPSTVVTTGIKIPSGVATATDARNFSYVGYDLRRIAWLGGGLVLLQLILWWLFTHTGLGPTVYSWVKL
jgi:hypothetical protein